MAKKKSGVPGRACEAVVETGVCDFRLLVGGGDSLAGTAGGFSSPTGDEGIR